MLKVEIHLTTSVPLSEPGVNQVTAVSQQILEQLGPELVRRCLEKAQDYILDHALGPKWSNGGQDAAPWTCPECGATSGFNRRGSYLRVLRKTSVGRVEFELRQVTCRHCGHTFSPFRDALGLEPYQASTTEFQAKAVEVACQTSYARAAQHVDHLGGVPVSATAIHQWVQDLGPKVVFDATHGDGKPVILDSTRVPAGENERGAWLNLGLSILERDRAHGRPRLVGYPVCFGVAESWTETGCCLKQGSPARLVFDGDENLVRWAEEALPSTPKQRGIWHLVTQLYWPLWRDGLRKQKSDPWLSRLGQLLYHPEDSLEETKGKLKSLIHDLSEQGLTEAATYLAAAAPYVFTYREDPDGVFVDRASQKTSAIRSTSPVERQMREINRRADVGARWGVSGVKNILALDLVRRFDPDQWQTLWQLPKEAVPKCSVVKLQVSVTVEAQPNVKTS